MNAIFFLITIIVGMLFEWSIGRMVFFSVHIPFLAMGLFFWFWRLRLSLRFGAALLIGFFSDSISLLSPGTHILVFVVLAFLTESLHAFFSNMFSRVAYILGISILTAIFLVLTPQFSRMIEWHMQFIK